MKNPYLFILIPLVLCLIFLIIGWIASIPETTHHPNPGTVQITPMYARTLEDAVESFGPNYAIATYVPRNYSFTHADCYCGPLRRIDTIYYIGPARYDSPRFTMTQQEGESPFCVGTVVGKSVPVTINGDNGTFIQGEKTGNSLTWSDGNYSFCIVGTVDQEQMIKMAESVRYSDKIELVNTT
jgi:hypothetical protein